MPLFYKFYPHLVLFSSFILVLALVRCKNETAGVAHKMNLSSPQGMALIPSGTLHMGGDNGQASDNEYPKHKVKIKSFYLDIHEVTNSEFTKFTTETGYITIAERTVDWEELKLQLPPNTPRPHDSILEPGALVFHPSLSKVSLNNPAAWWRWTIGANWKHPGGPESNIESIMSHPVVHIAWEDAMAYCAWAKKRLPTEAEWEWAARGGKVNKIYPWGNEPVLSGNPRANFYQGLFPYKNIAKDGYIGSAPVMSFPSNDYGLYDMSGNVWEWCSDWYDVSYYSKNEAKSNFNTGPTRSNNPMAPYQQEKVIRGGSFLCSDEYCSGYRNAMRMGSTIDTGLNHTGFRCARDL